MSLKHRQRKASRQSILTHILPPAWLKGKETWAWHQGLPLQHKLQQKHIYFPTSSHINTTVSPLLYFAIFLKNAACRLSMSLTLWFLQRSCQ